MTRAHDLPPRWDDMRVEWEPWQAETFTTAVFHLPLKDLACRACGNLGQRQTTRGRFPDDELHGHVVRLWAYRCDCGLDQVLDGLDADGQMWDLDDTDYGDEGSIDPSQVQGALF